MAGFTSNTPAQRGDLDQVPNSINLVSPAAFTATANGEFAAPAGCSVIEAVYTQTSGTAGQSLTIGIDGFDPSALDANGLANGAWENLITSAAITSSTTATVVVQVNPFSPPITNSSAQRPVRRRMRVVVTHADGKSVTYGVAVHAA